MGTIHEPQYIEISVMISEMASYDIKIPAEITPQTLPEVLRRLKAIQGMLPPTALDKTSSAQTPLLKLGLEESQDVVKMYQDATPRIFDDFIKEKYGVEGKSRASIASIVARLRKRVYKLRAKEKEKNQ